jgi:uncharacterized protein (DUF1015 family)
LRYNPDKISFISRVVAPPFDVIDGEGAELLRQQDAHNVIRLILGKVGESGRTDADYQGAAETLADWRREGVLVLEDEPAIYVCEQAFALEDASCVRRGFICAMLLEEFSSGRVLPHEQTMAGPKADRLRLMTACQASLSQVFGVFSDATGRADALVAEMAGSTPLYEFRDQNAVVYRLWKVGDPDAFNEVASLLRGETLFIADGHHRYEAALRYRELHRSSDGPPGAAPEDFLPVFCVSARNEGLKILPTHRLAKAPPGFKLATALRALHERFEVVEFAVSNAAGLEGALRESALGEAGIGCYLGGGRLLVLNPKPGLSLGELASDRAPEWQRLPVTVLHFAILEPLFAIPAQDTNKHPCLGFTQSVEELYWGVESARFDVGFLLPPIAPTTVEAVAAAGERMPPKSTFFYPKIASGLVFYSMRKGDSPPVLPRP